MRAAPLLAPPLMLLAAACGGCSGSPAASPVTTATVTATPSGTSTLATVATSPTPATTSSHVSGAPRTCLTSGLSLRLGARQGAAGSVYEPIVFTNTSASTCTMYGYPGVSFVAPGTGHQVGAAASRNPQHPPSTVILAPGARASALLQVVDAGNYSAASCRIMTVSGLRVYPPGNTAAAYLPFSAATTACSTQVRQLTVEATVIGPTGQ